MSVKDYLWDIVFPTCRTLIFPLLLPFGIILFGIILYLTIVVIVCIHMKLVFFPNFVKWLRSAGKLITTTSINEEEEEEEKGFRIMIMCLSNFIDMVLLPTLALVVFAIYNIRRRKTVVPAVP